MIKWVAAIFNRPKVIPETLWGKTLADFSFLARLSADDQSRLRALTGEFLTQKEFSGAHGLQITDAMAVAIAAQACLPVLHLSLRLYDDFKGIVVHPGAMIAKREVTDGAGIVHRYAEVLAGEAMDGGPVTLSWQDVRASDQTDARSYNVVIHEFVHKIDMRDGPANGCPPLPSRSARNTWQAVMTRAFGEFQEAVVMAERFGSAAPWLDAYGAKSPAEFFAVACEAYFIDRVTFTEKFPSLTYIFDQFFINTSPTARSD